MNRPDGGPERRLAQNSELRKRFETERKHQIREALMVAEELTQSNADRIERLRRLLRVVHRDEA